tara:strand:- start:236 stop:664 length:429 start_codon:yes stop_codon:yes gene_type:complete
MYAARLLLYVHVCAFEISFQVNDPHLSLLLLPVSPTFCLSPHQGYNNLPEKTAEAIDDQGYFHTGDIGKIVDGFVYILDRMKDLIIRGGENIDCSEVEAALNLHPAVRECSVFGLPDERLGEVVGAAIWCTAGTYDLILHNM